MANHARLAGLANQVAIVGVGETDYPADYRRVRAGERYSDSYGYATTAFKRALADGGLSREDIDGLIVGPTLAYERMAEIIGLEPRWVAKADAISAIFEGVLAITSGLVECIALVYGNEQRSAATAYGGPDTARHVEYISDVAGKALSVMYRRGSA